MVHNDLNQTRPATRRSGAGANLDAGSSFTVKGPNGSMSVAANPGQFSATLSAAGTFLVSRRLYRLGDRRSGCRPFHGTFTIPASPMLVSPVTNNLTVTRSSGMTVNWTGWFSWKRSDQVGSATDNTSPTAPPRSAQCPPAREHLRFRPTPCWRFPRQLRRVPVLPRNDGRRSRSQPRVSVSDVQLPDAAGAATWPRQRLHIASRLNTNRLIAAIRHLA